ncbi:MAG TPA: Uma2 family endonuclease [Allocoleopsis sp.]
MTVQILRKKFTVGQYHQMIESGILTDRDRVELIKGEIIEMSPVGRRHAACVDRLTELFVLRLTSRAIVRTQNPIRLSDDSEPQPDLALLRRRDDFYETGHPKPEDIFLVIEVSDTTVDFDREIKIPTYAEEGIAEAWLIDLNAQIIEVYQQPVPSGYQSKQQFDRGQSITLPGFSGIQFDVEQLLG